MKCRPHCERRAMRGTPLIGLAGLICLAAIALFILVIVVPSVALGEPSAVISEEELIEQYRIERSRVLEPLPLPTRRSTKHLQQLACLPSRTLLPPTALRSLDM